MSPTCLLGVVVALLAAGAAGLAPPAGAGVSVASDGARVVVAGYRAGGEDYQHWTASSPTGRLVQCRELIDETDGIVDSDGVLAGLSWPPLDPSRVARWRYWLDCRYRDGAAVELGNTGLGYVYADEVLDYDAAVTTAAEQYLAETLAPSLAVGTSPPAGLVGFEQWFWVQGTSGAFVDQVHDVFGRRVVLQLELAEVRWTFGDGTEAVFGPQGLGIAEAAGPVTHRYRWRSTTASPSATYRLGVTVVIALRYTLDGGDWLEANPALRARAGRDLVVREAQAVGHG